MNLIRSATSATVDQQGTMENIGPIGPSYLILSTSSNLKGSKPSLEAQPHPAMQLERAATSLIRNPAQMTAEIKHIVRFECAAYFLLYLLYICTFCVVLRLRMTSASYALCVAEMPAFTAAQPRLNRSTRYSVCVPTSGWHPDQIGPRHCTAT